MLEKVFGTPTAVKGIWRIRLLEEFFPSLEDARYDKGVWTFIKEVTKTLRVMVDIDRFYPRNIFSQRNVGERELYQIWNLLRMYDDLP